MNIQLINKGNYHFVANNEGGQQVTIDASPAIGGENKGARPMELLIMGLGGCSGIDVINILKKQKQPLRDIKITATGEREKEVVPSLFVEAHVHFRLYGDLDEEKVKRAVSLSVDKYCSVAKTMSHKATITHSFEILP